MNLLRFLNTPGARLASVLILGALICIVAVEIAISQLRLNINIETGSIIQSSAGTETVEALDLLGEPGELAKYRDFNRFFERQDRLTQILAGSPVNIIPKDRPAITIRPQKPSLLDLNSIFWIQLAVGLGSLVISGWIWSLRPKDLGVVWFALSGLSMITSAVPSAIYTSREFALPGNLFLWLEYLNAAGAAFFGISIIGLFLVYPLRLKNWKAWLIGESILFSAWFAGFVLQAVPETFGISLIIVVEMAVICALIVAQFLATRRNAQARASLVWLGLSVLIGAGAFVIFNTLPLLLETTPMHQGYAFLFFLIIYLGLAAGLTRFRLFEVGQWAFRFLFYATGALTLMLVDAALVFMMGVGRLPALGIALFAVGFLYLPLRDLIWRRFTRTGQLESYQLISEALHVAFASTAMNRAERWQALLKKFFDPLEMTAIEQPVKSVKIIEDGLTLLLPPVAGASSIKLRYAWAGRALFTSESKAIAEEIVNLIEEAESSREAYDRGVTEERQRMAQDLHDDVGARLLTGLYLADEKLRPTLQGAIADIRTIVSGITGEKVALSELIADLRHETTQRLESAGIELQWSLGDVISDQLFLDYRQHKALSSAVREVVSNVLRHSQASKMTVVLKIQNEMIELTLNDNGRGFITKSIEPNSFGYGLKSLQRRLSDIHGSFEIASSSQGTKVLLRFPFS